MNRIHRNTRQLGYCKETLAFEFLKSHGIKLIERNYQCRLGEIDLIVQDQSFLVFVEVRFRSRCNFGRPIESVDKFKQAKIIRCAQNYLLRNTCSDSYPCRFDVIGIQNGKTPGTQDIQWIRDAFQL